MRTGFQSQAATIVDREPLSIETLRSKRGRELVKAKAPQRLLANETTIGARYAKTGVDDRFLPPLKFKNWAARMSRPIYG
jgi:hypothetical protein